MTPDEKKIELEKIKPFHLLGGTFTEKNISDIYSKYKIPPQLQTHQLRVAAVANLICNNISNFLETRIVIQTCLVHDMGNIIKSNLDAFPEFLEPQGKKYWQDAKDEFIKKYGDDEHLASITIARELGLSERVINIIDRINFSKAVENSRLPDLATKICVYSDARVSPKSVSSLKERLDESYARNHNDPGKIQSNPILYKAAAEAMFAMEKEIFSNSNLKPTDVTTEKLEEIITNLELFEI